MWYYCKSKLCKDVIFILILLWFCSDSIGKTQCGICFKFIHPCSFKRHVKNQHGNTDSSQVLCDVRNKMYKNEATMKEHKRIAHKIYQRINFD